MTDRINKADLDMLAARASGGKPLHPPETHRLIEQIRRLRSLLLAVYPVVKEGERTGSHWPEATMAAIAVLDREVVAISDEGGV